MKPFDLEKALAGEPILTRDRQKGYVKFTIENNAKVIRLVGVVNNGSIVEVEKWLPSGNVLSDDITPNDIIGMWEEPRPRVQLDLPAPLKAPQEGMWYIAIASKEAQRSNYYKSNKNSFDEDKLDNGFYFATREDAQEWLDAMRNARR